jgi:two-component system LytT family response regulator
MSTVLILEDEKYTLEFLEVFVGNHPMVDRVFAAKNSQDAIEAAKEYLPDIALLDIELDPQDRIDGIQTAKIISSISPNTELVFVTGYGKYAIDSFVVHPYDYVLKPIRKDKLMEIITELSIRTEKTKTKITIKTADGTAILDPDQIFYIVKEGRHSIIHSQQGCFKTFLSLIDLEAILSQQFIKTHSAFIVNISKILTINPTNSRNYQIIFRGYDKTAWISRGGFKKYKALFAADT